MGCKIFPYTFMHGGQARPYRTHQRFTYPLQLPSISFLSKHPSCLTLMSSGWGWSCRLWKGLVGLTISLFMSMNAQARSTGSLRPSALPYVNKFIKLSELPLSATPYSIAPLALADGLWSLIFFFYYYFFLIQEKRKGHLWMITQAAIIKC